MGVTLLSPLGAAVVCILAFETCAPRREPLHF